jgi:hypothetical protein
MHDEGESFRLLTYCKGHVIYSGSWRRTRHDVIVRYANREVQISLYDPNKSRQIARSLLEQMVDTCEHCTWS